MAQREVHRILKPDGMHVFTVPIICDRHETRQRATIKEGRLIHLLPPSYHGGVNGGKSDFLVFYEFGSDFIERCEKSGFHVLAIRDPENLALVAFIARKTARNPLLDRMLLHLHQNSFNLSEKHRKI